MGTKHSKKRWRQELTKTARPTTFTRVSSCFTFQVWLLRGVFFDWSRSCWRYGHWEIKHFAEVSSPSVVTRKVLECGTTQGISFRSVKWKCLASVLGTTRECSREWHQRLVLNSWRRESSCPTIRSLRRRYGTRRGASATDASQLGTIDRQWELFLSSTSLSANRLTT